MKVSTTKHPHQWAAASNNYHSINGAAVPIFLTLVALNFAIFTLNVWFFLPTSSPLLFETTIQKTHKPDPAAQALRQALYNTSDKVISYDVVPNILDQTNSFHGVVHTLPSIPASRRMFPISTPEKGHPTVPHDAASNLAYFLESRNFPVEDQPLFLYNPMLLPLDEQVLDSAIIGGLSNGLGPNHVAYVGVYRVSNFGNCHGPGRGLPPHYLNYLGLALLDRELNVIRDPVSGEYLDAVIDLNIHLWQKRWTPFRKYAVKPKQFMQDCQLFPAHSNEGTKSAQLILLCNEYAMPVDLKLKRSPPQASRNKDPFITFDNMYGSQLQLVALREPNMIIYSGKNMHAFSNQGRGYLELWAGGPHEVASLDFNSYPYVNRDGGLGFENVEVTSAVKPEPDATFLTETEVHFFNNRSMLIDRDSGSTCCVKINWKADDSGDERELLLGFSHRKTLPYPKRFKYSYVTRVYAFDPNPPFDVIARSGLFCLGFASANETKTSENEQVRGATTFYKLKLWKSEYNCPKIHFVTGITEKYGDSETVIISYGVNDCYPRMLEVSKEFLVSLLRPT